MAYPTADQVEKDLIQEMDELWNLNYELQIQNQMESLVNENQAQTQQLEEYKAELDARTDIQAAVRPVKEDVNEQLESFQQHVQIMEQQHDANRKHNEAQI